MLSISIGRAAAQAGTKLQIAVYGGSALMLASNFRLATEDVDVSKLEHPLPGWLQDTVAEIATRNGWGADWFNDHVVFHLSPLADRAADHLEFGTFPRDGTPPGLEVSVPSAEYLLALKLKAFRITGSSSRGHGAAGHLEFDESGWNLDRRRSHRAAWSILSSKRGILREAALLAEEHGPGGGADAPKYPR
ncbi:hypothetical protein ACU4GH_12500 [Bradyrhizobium betae]